MRPIDKFMKSNKPLERSKLSELDEDILELLSNKFKPKQIHEYIIVLRKISITQRRVYQYIKELQTRDKPKAPVANIAAAAPSVLEKENKITSSAPVQELQKEEKQETTSEKRARLFAERAKVHKTPPLDEVFSKNKAEAEVNSWKPTDRFKA